MHRSETYLIHTYCLGRNALADINFYECAYRCSESACTAILKKITINDADISTYLVREVLDKVYTGVQMKIYMVS